MASKYDKPPKTNIKKPGFIKTPKRTPKSRLAKTAKKLAPTAKKAVKPLVLGMLAYDAKRMFADYKAGTLDVKKEMKEYGESLVPPLLYNSIARDVLTEFPELDFIKTMRAGPSLVGQPIRQRRKK